MEKPNNRFLDKNKLFTLPTLLLALFCIAINIGLSKLVELFGWPLFIDSIGTVLSAALGGLIPGILVGFLSNAINSFDDPITLYYGIISIFMAIAISEISRSGLLRKIWGYLIAVVVLAFAGGVLGSILTWLLYGYNIGTGISAPFASAFFEDGMAPFWAQFSADVLIDLFDKLITMTVVFFCLWFYPKKLYGKFPLSYVYDKKFTYTECKREYYNSFKFKQNTHSLRYKIMTLVIITAVVLSAISITLGMLLYRKNTEQDYANLCKGVSAIVRDSVDGDRVDDYLLAGDTAKSMPDYIATQEKLENLLVNLTEVEYIYVYKISSYGVHVVFDIDTADVEGEKVGAVFSPDESFAEYMPDLCEGKGVGPVISNDTYGWLLTVYEPIKDSSGKCVAFACADVNMQRISTQSVEFFIRLFALLFAATVVIIMLVLWFGDRKIVAPINTLVTHVQSFEQAKTENNLSTFTAEDAPDVKTGDEIEVLYNAVRRSEQEISDYLSELKQINEEMARLQQNTITSFADMVERRDQNTGDHINRTTDYVKTLCGLLAAHPEYSEELTPENIDMICQAAPLHDIGKISIPDSILNKPGKLSKEEFELMKSHTTNGMEIIKSTLVGIQRAGYLNTAMEMAEYHHERWDGKGYPCGLAKEDIPLCARIMAVADVLDALVSKRSYKEPFTFEKAMDIFKEESGTHFDPYIMQIFFENADLFRRD